MQGPGFKSQQSSDSLSTSAQDRARSLWVWREGSVSRKQSAGLDAAEPSGRKSEKQLSDLWPLPERGEDRSLLPGKKDDSKSSPGEEVAAKTGDRFPHFVSRSDPEAGQPWLYSRVPNIFLPTLAKITHFSNYNKRQLAALHAGEMQKFNYYVEGNYQGERWHMSSTQLALGLWWEGSLPSHCTQHGSTLRTSVWSQSELPKPWAAKQTFSDLSLF